MAEVQLEFVKGVHCPFGVSSVVAPQGQHPITGQLQMGLMENRPLCFKQCAFYSRAIVDGQQDPGCRLLAACGAVIELRDAMRKEGA